MSKDKETATLEGVSWQWVEDVAKELCAADPSVKQACRKALDARKSKYERWCERRSWPTQEDFEVDNYLPEAAKLLAAAPELFQTLVDLLVLVRHRGLLEASDNEDIAAIEAIRKAAPIGVVDEILAALKDVT